MKPICQDYQEQISALLDGELSKAESERLRTHMEACADCRAVYKAFSTISAAIPEALPKVPEDLHGQIMASIQAAGPARKAPRPSPRRFVRPILAAACLVAVVAGAVIGLNRERISDTVTATTTLSGGASASAASAGGDAGAPEASLEEYMVEDAEEGTLETAVAVAEEPVPMAAPEAEAIAQEDVLYAAASNTANGAAKTESVRSTSSPSPGQAAEQGSGAASASDLDSPAESEPEAEESADLQAAADFFAGEPDEAVLLAYIPLKNREDSVLVYLWYEEDTPMCSFHEDLSDAKEVRSLEELLSLAEKQ